MFALRGFWIGHVYIDTMANKHVSLLTLSLLSSADHLQQQQCLSLVPLSAPRSAGSIYVAFHVFLYSIQVIWQRRLFYRVPINYVTSPDLLVLIFIVHPGVTHQGWVPARQQLHFIQISPAPAPATEDGSNDQHAKENGSHVPGKGAGHEHHIVVHFALAFARHLRIPMMRIVVSMPGLPTERVVQVEGNLPEPRALQGCEESPA